MIMSRQETEEPDLCARDCITALYEKLSLSKPLSQICCPSLARDFTAHLNDQEYTDMMPIQETLGGVSTEAIKTFCHNRLAVRKPAYQICCPLLTCSFILYCTAEQTQEKLPIQETVKMTASSKNCSRDTRESNSRKS